MEFITVFGTPKKKEPTVFEKIKAAVKQTKENFTGQIQDLVEGQKEIDADMLEQLEAIMIGADIGVSTTNDILKVIKDRMSRKMLQDPKELHAAERDSGRKPFRHSDGRGQWSQQNDDHRETRQSVPCGRQERHDVRRRH